MRSTLTKRTRILKGLLTTPCRAALLPGLLLLTGCRPAAEPEAAPAPQAIRTAGSTTMDALMRDTALRYQAQAGGPVIEHEPGGSGHGLAQLVNGHCDIARVSRGLAPGDHETAQRAGVILRSYTLGVGAIVLVAHGDRAPTLRGITPQQARTLFVEGGELSWRDLGAPEDHPIRGVAGPADSGTTKMLVQAVRAVDGMPLHPRIDQQESTRAVLSAVAQDPWAIGIASLAHLQSSDLPVRDLAVRAMDGQDVRASEMTILAGRYPWARPLNAVVTLPLRAELARFLDFALSPAGQTAIARHGFIPIRLSPQAIAGAVR